MRRTVLIASAALALALTARGREQPPPDLILHHARIDTAIDAQLQASALATRGDHLVTTAPAAEILTTTVITTMVGGRWIYES